MLNLAANLPKGTYEWQSEFKRLCGDPERDGAACDCLLDLEETCDHGTYFEGACISCEVDETSIKRFQLI